MEDIRISAIKTKSILTKSNLPASDYCANPYVGCTHACKYCYASYMRRFTGHREDWGRFLDVKFWPPLENVEKYRGRTVFLSSVTDPYNPQEAVFKRTRTLLEELSGSGIRLSISTKSDLILRDLDLIRNFPQAQVAWSVNTLDESFRADMDSAVPVERRLRAMKIFHDSGVRTTCFISPIFPGITDVKAIIRTVKDQCNLIWLENLNLRGAFKSVILSYIREKRPELTPLYEMIYNRKDMSWWEELDRELAAYTSSLGLEYRINDNSFTRPFSDPPVVVNFFYHEKIRKNASSKASVIQDNAQDIVPAEIQPE